MYTTTRLTTAPTATFISENYYREYFTTDGQGYATATAIPPPTRNIYGEDVGHNGSAIHQPSYETRSPFTGNGATNNGGNPLVIPNQGAGGAGGGGGGGVGQPPPPPPHPATVVVKNGGTPIYTKTVTAAGLTVDLPSPDSGIGADAITPRDQNNIQQVCPVNIVAHQQYINNYNY